MVRSDGQGERASKRHGPAMAHPWLRGAVGVGGEHAARGVLPGRSTHTTTHSTTLHTAHEHEASLCRLAPSLKHTLQPGLDRPESTQPS